MFNHLFPRSNTFSWLQDVNPKGDWRLFIIPLLLAFFGLLMIYEASSVMAIDVFEDRLYFFKRQALWFAISIVAFFITARLNHFRYRKFAPVTFLVNIILLVVVLIPGIGIEVSGGRRWLAVAGFSFQPSELMKISLSMYLASLLSKPTQRYVVYVIIMVVSGLIILEPDMGTMLIVVGVASVIYLTSGISKKEILGAASIFIIVASLLIISSPYRLARVTTYLNPHLDTLGSSYHLRQVLIALGNGGWFGQGLGMSRQKYLYIPEVTTDSIFAVVAEEVGFVGVVMVILIYGYYFYLCFYHLSTRNDRYSGLLGVGLITSIFLQFFINIGAISALVPLTGIPLPFISYGGTALLINFICAGLLYNISRPAKSI